MNRRTFLAHSTTLAVTAAVSRMSAASDTVRVACVGLGCRGDRHLRGFAHVPGAEVVALCDAAPSRLASASRTLQELGKRQPALYADHQQLFERTDFDAVSIALPRLERGQVARLAGQARKDLYLDRAAGESAADMRQIVALARTRSQVIRQDDAMRTWPAARQAVRYLQDGLIGDVQIGRALAYVWSADMGRSGSSASDRAVMDLALDAIEMARWGLGVGFPCRVTTNATPQWPTDSGPASLNCSLLFDSGGRNRVLEVEVRRWTAATSPGAEKASALFYGSTGFLVLNDAPSYRSWLGQRQIPGPASTNAQNSYRHFIEAIRSRQQLDDHDIDDRHTSVAILRLVDASVRVGRPLAFDPLTQAVIGDPEASAMLSGELS